MKKLITIAFLAATALQVGAALQVHQIPSSTTSTLYGVAVGKSSAMAVGTNGMTARLSVGNERISSATNTASQSLVSVAFGGDKYVAGGVAGRVFENAGGTWTEISAITEAGRGDVSGMTFNGEKFSASQVGTRIRQSKAPLPWATTYTAFAGTIKAISAPTASLQVAVGSAGNSYVSVNGGASYTVRNTGAGATAVFLGVAGTPGGQLVAVGVGGIVATSANSGTSWTVRPALGGNLNAVTYADGRFIAVGDGGKAYESPNGAAWTPIATGTEENLYGVAYGATGTTFAGLIFAVGANGTILVMGEPPSVQPSFDWVNMMTDCFSGRSYTVNATSTLLNAKVDWLNKDNVLVKGGATSYTFEAPGELSGTNIVKARFRDTRVPELVGPSREAALKINPRPIGNFLQSSITYFENQTSVTLPKPIIDWRDVGGTETRQEFFAGHDSVVVTPDGQFNPSTSPFRTATAANPNRVTYFYFNANGCAFSNTLDVIVFKLPVITFKRGDTILENVGVARNGGTTNLALLTLVETNANSGSGAFSSIVPNAVTPEGIFNPAVPGLQISTTTPLLNDVTYTFTNENNAIAVKTLYLIVWREPEIGLNADPVKLNRASGTTSLLNFVSLTHNASNGTAVFMGDGAATDGTFNPADPSVEGSTTPNNVQTNKVVVIYTNNNQAKATSTLNIVVYELPVITFTPETLVVFRNEGTINVAAPGILSVVTNASSGTGTFSLLGVTQEGVFDPTIAGLKISTTAATRETNYVRYTFSNSNSVTVIKDLGIVVYREPDVNVQTNLVKLNRGSAPIQLNGAAYVTFTPNGPAGTVIFNGPGVTPSGTFNPANPLVVDYTTSLVTNSIQVVYQNGNGAKETNFIAIAVAKLPVVTPVADLTICNTDAPVSLASFFTVQTNAASGSFVFTGTGVTNGLFTPNLEQLGPVEISYTFTNFNQVSVSGNITLTVEECRPTISAALTAQGVTLTWDNPDYQLQVRSSLTEGEWTTVADAQSGVIRPTTGTQEYYRLIKP